MNERVLKKLNIVGGTGITVGIIARIFGITIGIISIVNGAKAISVKKHIEI